MAKCSELELVFAKLPALCGFTEEETQRAACELYELAQCIDDGKVRYVTVSWTNDETGDTKLYISVSAFTCLSDFVDANRWRDFSSGTMKSFVLDNGNLITLK